MQTPQLVLPRRAGLATTLALSLGHAACGQGQADQLASARSAGAAGASSLSGGAGAAGLGGSGGSDGT